MPFGRKNKKKLIVSIVNFIRIFFAFSRAKKYISLSIKRIKGSPQALSLGLATGIAVSFTPFIGLHALLAIFISWTIGGFNFQHCWTSAWVAGNGISVK